MTFACPAILSAIAFGDGGSLYAASGQAKAEALAFEIKNPISPTDSPLVGANVGNVLWEWILYFMS